MYYVTAFLLALACVTASIAQPLSPDASEFVNRGAQTALSQCDLPKRTCKTDRLVVKSADVGESNDEKRSVETLALKGMVTIVAFTMANRKNYYLGSVEITDAHWPAFKGIMVGAPRDTVIKTIGLPNNETNNSCDTYVDEEHESGATICYHSGNVSRIRWEY